MPSLESLEERSLLSVLTVTNLNDSAGFKPGDGSLRGEIAAAGSNDTIEFSPSLAGGTITLEDGLLELSQNLTITAPTGGIAISGNGQTNIFFVDRGVTASLTGLTITDGNSGQEGGGIDSDGNLTMTDCTVSGNFAQQNGGGIFNKLGDLTLSGTVFNANECYGNGGGLYNVGGTVTITNSSFTYGFLGGSGGAIYNNGGNVTVTGSNLQYNNAIGNGGGIANEADGTLTVSNSTIDSNQGANGGGIFNAAGASATVTGGNVSANFLQYSGGDIDNAGNLTVTGVTFDRGAASDGGIIDNSGVLVLGDSFITGGNSPNGGGLDNQANGTATVINTTFYLNTASGNGGNVDNSGGTLLLTNCTITLGYASTGGGVANTSGTVTLANTLVAGNVNAETNAPDDVSGTLTANYSLIGNTSGVTFSTSSGNNLLNVNPDITSPSNFGGPTDTCALEPDSPALNAGSDALAVDANGNPLTTDQRGGIYQRISGASVDIGAFEYEVFSFVVSTTSDENDGNDSYGHFSLREAVGLADQNFAGITTITFDPTIFATPQTITLNAVQGPITLSTDISITGPAAGVTILGSDSGRVFETVADVFQGVSINLSDLTISGGGLLNAESTVLSLTNCTLSGNQDTASPFLYGGALQNDGTANLTDCAISDNTGVFGGAAESLGTMTLTDCTISGNTSLNFQLDGDTLPGSGGALYNQGELTIDSSTLTGNTTPGSGGAIAGDGILDLSGSSISGNSAAYGGGIDNVSGQDTLSDTSVSNNIAKNGGGIASGGKLSLVDCTISGNTANHGGGVYNYSGSATILGSTFSDNSASLGGGLFSGLNFGLEAVSSTLADCTFYGNSASSHGGAVYSTEGNINLTNCTVTSNQAPSGAGLDFNNADAGYGYPDVVILANTITAGNLDGGTTPDDLDGPVTANDDLIGASANATFLAGSGYNILGVTNPGLSPLADNGGPTETCALLPGSQAIDAGSDALAILGTAPLTTDQRGLARTVGTSVDIGADEYQVDLAAALAAVPATVVTGQSLTYTLTVTNYGPDAAAPVLTDAVPAGTQLQSWTTSDAGWVLTTPAVVGQVTATANLATGQTLAPGASAVFSLTVQVTAPGGTVVAESAAVGPTTDDTNPANNATAVGQTTVALGVTSIANVSPNPRNTAVSTIDVTFDEPIDLNSFTDSALTLTDNNGPNLITSGVTVTFVSGSTYQINGLTDLTQSNGEYALTVNSATIQDLNGNPGVNSLATAWLMDVSPPSSTVDALPARETSLTFPVWITAADQGNPASGVAYTTIYSSTNNGPWTYWTTVLAPFTTANFTGQSNTSYAFYSVATDYANNTESKSPAVEASTYVPDLTPPITSVDGTTGSNPSTVNSSTGTFTLNLTGNDPGGSVLEYFMVYVSIDGGSYNEVGPYAIPAGPAESGGNYHSTITYQGLTDGNSHSYSFYSVGLDAAGNTQVAPSSPNVTFSNQTFAAPSQLQVSGFTVEHGSPSRSFIQYLDLTFNESDSQSGGALSNIVNSIDGRSPLIQIYQYDLNDDASSKTSLPLDTSPTTLDVLDHAIEINFGSGGILGSPNTTAADGYYEVDIDLPNGTVATHYFYRLLGDVNGDQVVDASDLATISANLNETSQVGWTPLSADVNGDGSVSALDLTLATRAKGHKLKSGLTLG